MRETIELEKSGESERAAERQMRLVLVYLLRIFT